MKFSLSEMLDGRKQVKAVIEQNLKSRLYHKTGEVTQLYATTLGISIWPERKDFEELTAAINHRHDCVHRNGKTKDDQRLNIFTISYVTEAIELAEKVVRHIQSQLDSKEPF